MPVLFCSLIVIKMGHYLSTHTVQSRECKLIAIQNPEHTIQWPPTFADLIDYLSQIHPEARQIKFCYFLTALGEKRVYNEATYAAMIPAYKIYDGNIQVFSVFLWRVSPPIYFSSHVHLLELTSPP